jgi:hypothetical protein
LSVNIIITTVTTTTLGVVGVLHGFSRRIMVVQEPHRVVYTLSPVVVGVGPLLMGEALTTPTPMLVGLKLLFRIHGRRRRQLSGAVVVGLHTV